MDVQLREILSFSNLINLLCPLDCLRAHNNESNVWVCYCRAEGIFYCYHAVLKLWSDISQKLFYSFRTDGTRLDELVEKFALKEFTTIKRKQLRFYSAAFYF
jgi:hypothetical protein